MSGAGAAQVPVLWARAAARYEEITHKKLSDPAFAGLKTVQDLESLVERENTSFSSFRAQRHAIFGAMGLALRPVEVVLDVVAGDVSNAFPPSALVFGAVRYLFGAAKGVSEKYDAIAKLMGELADFTVRLEVYSREAISERLLAKLADVVVALVEVLAISREEIKHGRFFSFGKGILGANKEAQAAVEKLRSLVEGERGLVGAETLTEVKGVSTEVKSISTGVKGVSTEVKGVSVAVGDLRTQISGDMSTLSRQIEALALVQHASKDEAQEVKLKGHMEKLKTILRPTVVSEDKYWAINRNRVAGTGDWIREQAAFVSWMKREHPVLWISGNPGSGKSYIASNLISYLYEQYPQKVQHPCHVSVAFFYFKDDDNKTRSFHQALRDMAYMIALNDQTYAKSTAARLESPDNISTLSSAWRNLFSEFFIRQSGDSRVCLLLDGMDEAYNQDREEFFDLARDIEEGGRIQLVMLGRFQIWDEIAQIMERPDVPTIPITPTSNYADIVQYIEISISKSAFLRRASKDMRKEIVEKISTKAQGMFIWVDLMLKDILKRTGITSWKVILNALDKAPRGIDKMIRHVLEGYSAAFENDPEAVSNLNEMLAWVTCTETPLKLSELENILKWGSGPDADMIWLERTLRVQFASIFVLTREDGLTTADLQRTGKVRDDAPLDDPASESISPDPGVVSNIGVDDIENPTEFDSDPDTTVVTFSHASIGDFFRDESQGKVSSDIDCPAVGVNFHDARVHCLKTCLDVLCEHAFPQEGLSIPQPIYRYSATAWIYYLTNTDISRTQKTDKEHIGQCLAKLLVQDHRAWDFISFTGAVKIVTKERAELITKWIGDEDVLASLPAETREAYIDQVKENSLDIFSRVVKSLSKAWLDWLPGMSLPYCWFIIQFRSVRYDIPFPSNFELSADEVIRAAEWCGLERTALWHRRLAMTLRDLGHYTEALDYFHQSIALDPPLWIARSGIVRVYNAMGDTNAVIEYGTQFIADLTAAYPDSPGTAWGAAWDNFHTAEESVAEAYGQLGDFDRALEHYRAGFSHSPRCHKCLRGMLGILNMQRRHAEVMDVFRSLDDPKGPAVQDKSYTRLTEVLFLQEYVNSIFWASFVAAAHHCGPEAEAFIVDAHRRALAAARRERRFITATVVELQLATLLDRAGDHDSAARLWEHLIVTYQGTRAEKYVSAIIYLASVALANFCLMRCMEAEAGPTGIEGRRYGATIEWLARGAGRDSPAIGSPEVAGGIAAAAAGSGVPFERDASGEYPVEYIRFITASTLGMTLGQYYQILGREADARAIFRMQIREGLWLLGDDDPDNDEEAYSMLAYVLGAVRDDENALAAWRAVADFPVQDDEGDANDMNGNAGETDPQAAHDVQNDGKGRQETAGEGEKESGGEENGTEDAAATVQGKNTESEDSGKEDNKESPTAKEDKTPMYLNVDLVCDGCFRPIILGEFFICRYCNNTGFCDDCIGRVKAGTFPVKVCSTRHDWLLLGPPPKSLGEPPEKAMLVGDKWVGFEEWKDGLRKKWNL